MTSKELLQEITTRLEREVPQGVYINDKWLAEALGIKHKTLINKRGSKSGRYPEPLHMGEGQTGLHPRRELIQWLAKEELRARTRRVHKCS